MDPWHIVTSILGLVMAAVVGAVADLFRRVRGVEERTARAEEREPSSREAIDRLQASLDRLTTAYETAQHNQVEHMRRLDRMEQRLEYVIERLESRDR